MKNTLMVQVCAFPGSPNHQIPGVCVQVFRFSSQVWALMFGNSGFSIQVCAWVLTFSIHIQVVRFRYSDSGIQVWNSDLGIQDWVYRLADKYKALTFSIHIQGIQVYNSGLGVQTCLYTQACIPIPESEYLNLTT